MSEYMKKVPGTEGVCPYCGNDGSLQYSPFIVLSIKQTFGYGYYPFKCSICGNDGEEWYSINFIYHEIKDEDRGGLVV